MIYKVYLKKIDYCFLLPMNPEKVFSCFVEQYKRSVSDRQKTKDVPSKLSISKLYPVISIRDKNNDEIDYLNINHRNLSILLLNYLLYFEKLMDIKVIENISDTDNIDNEFIISKLEEILNLDDKELSFLKMEEIEKFLNDKINTLETKESLVPSDRGTNSTEDTSDTSDSKTESIKESSDRTTNSTDDITNFNTESDYDGSVFNKDKVNFSMSWVKQASIEIKEKKRKKRKEGKEND